MSDEEKKYKILEAAQRLFIRYGIKSLTMDDLARELGISKKTLYLYCEDKNDLIRQVMEFEMGDHCSKIWDIQGKELNAIDENLEVLKQVMSDFSEMHPGVLYDLRRYHPEAYSKYENFKKDFMSRCVAQNIEKGIKEGFYRDDIRVDIIVTNYMYMISNIFESSEIFGKQHNFLTIYEELFKYHINGIATNKGRKYLAEKYISMNLNQ